MSPLAVIPTNVWLIHPYVCVEGILAFTHTVGYTFSIPVASYSALSLTCN